MSVSNMAEPSFGLRRIDAVIAAAALAAIIGGLCASPGDVDGWQWLHWIAKPLATLLILGVAWRTAPAISVAYRRWIAVGMAFSLLGDVFLMLPVDAFVAGLVAFLVAHLCFLRALCGDSRFATPPWPLLACVAYGGLNLWALWPTLPDALHVPVVVYVLVLATMGGQAVGRAVRHARDALAVPAPWAAAGALLFMLSDTLLAWNRFRVGIPLATLWVLATYYAALWCLARSVRRAGGHA